MKYFICILCMLLFAARAFGQGATHFMAEGNLVHMGKHAGLRIVREKTNVKLGRDQHDTVKVKCEFVIKNEGKAVTVKLGFPVDSQSSDKFPINQSVLTGFKMSVDGTPVKPSFKSKREKIGEDSMPYAEQSFWAWYIEDIRFEANQTRSIVITYSTELSRTGDSPWEFIYNLSSDGLWNWPAGEVAFSADISSLSHYLDVNTDPNIFTRHGDKLTWVRQDVKPVEEVKVNVSDCFVPTMNGKPIKYEDPLGYYDFQDGVLMLDVGVLEHSGVLRVIWGEKRRVCNIHGNSRTLTLIQGSKTAILNGTTKVSLPAAPLEGGWEIPIEAVMKALGGSVSPDRVNGVIRLTLPVPSKAGGRNAPPAHK